MKEREKIIRALPKIARSIAIISIGLSLAILPADATNIELSPLPDYHTLITRQVKNETSINELLYGPAEFLLTKANSPLKETLEKPKPTPTELPIPKEGPVPRETNTTDQSVDGQISVIAPGEIPDEVFDSLAECESGQDWHKNTGNGFYGGIQFLPSTWESVGGAGLPNEASRGEQIKRARILQKRSGWGQWPGCSRKLGLLPNTS